METPSKISNLWQLVDQLKISVQVDAEITAILEEIYQKLYTLAEEQKRMLAVVRNLEQESNLHKRRYSELLYKFSDIQKTVEK